MDSARWKQVDSLFHLALERPLEEREEFLRRAGGGDSTLQDEVRLLLSLHQKAGSFLEEPALEVAAEAMANQEMDQAQEDDEFAAGPAVSHYRIVGKLGGGGMGVVYKARDAGLGRYVALKFLPKEFSKDREKLERFQREAWAASALNHPNICTIYEIGNHDGRPFIAMELIEGQTIAEKLKDGPLAVERAMGIARQIAEALDEAHEHNIIHRDLKPLNIMVTAKGRAKVLDFGLAKLLRPAESDAPTQENVLHTQAGAVMGTIPYMAPEQLCGGPVDARTDLYALGAVLYEMATGERPFPQEQTNELIAAILTYPPRPPSELNPGINAQLEGVILKALAKEPEERYGAAQELLADLSLQGTAVQPARAAGPATLRRTPDLRTAAPVLIAVIGITLLVFLVLLLSPSVRSHFMRSPLAVQDLSARKQLAVLPFSVFGGSPGDNAFSRGLAETLAAKLTQLSPGNSLQVVPVGELAARHVTTVKEAREAFGVNLALTGSIEHGGDLVRVSFTLVNASSVRQLRAETVTLADSDPFGIEDRVVDGTASMLGLNVPPAEREAIGTHGTQAAGAFHDYLTGLGYLQNYDRAENIDHAIDSFQSALKVDSAFTLAYAGLGRAYWLKYTTTEDTAWVDRAQESCSHAVTLDAKLPATHLCLGILESGTGRYAEAVQQFQRVVKAEPTSYPALEALAFAQFNLKQTSEAETTYQRAISLRPNYWAPYDGLGVLYFKVGDAEKAAEMFKKVIQLAPENHLGLCNLGGAYLLLGKWTEAEEMLKKSIAIHPTAEAYSNLGALTFAERRFDQSAGYFEKAVRLQPKDETLQGNLAEAYKWSSNKRAMAVPAYRKAAALARDGLRVNPRSYEKLGKLAMYEAQSSNFKQAIRDLHKALSLAPRDVQLIYYAALIYYLSGQRANALEYLRRACKAGYPVETILSDPEWEAVKADPEFRKAIGAE